MWPRRYQGSVNERHVQHYFDNQLQCCATSADGVDEDKRHHLVVREDGLATVLSPSRNRPAMLSAGERDPYLVPATDANRSLSHREWTILQRCQAEFFPSRGIFAFLWILFLQQFAAIQTQVMAVSQCFRAVSSLRPMYLPITPKDSSNDRNHRICQADRSRCRTHAKAGRHLLTLAVKG